jgi:hypothetical protein
MRYTLILIVAAILFTACNKRVQPLGDAVTVFPAKEAKNHIGEVTSVSGTISEIFVSRQNTNVYLYLDGDIKDAQFVAVWPGTNDPPVKALKNLIFKAEPISVSGKIVTEKGVPEIIVSYWAQIN